MIYRRGRELGERDNESVRERAGGEKVGRERERERERVRECASE